MSKRAVLIGCNFTHTAVEKNLQLRGCINDAELFKEVLVQKFGFLEKDIAMLVDREQDDTLPTAANIKKKIREAVKASQDGDVLVIHYSGHGIQTEATNDNDEADGMNEALVTADARFITDNKLKELIAKLHRGVRLTFITDCCHSGTMLDQPLQHVQVTGDTPAPWAPPAAAPPPAESDAPAGEAAASECDTTAVTDAAAAEGPAGAAEGEGADGPASLDECTRPADCPPPRNRGLSQAQVVALVESVHGPTEAPSALRSVRSAPGLAPGAAAVVEDLQLGASPVTLPDHCALLTGCMDNQKSADDNIGCKYHGAFTYSLVHAISSREGDQTYREVIQAARTWLASQRTEGSDEQRYDQDPCLNCADDVADAVFICERVRAGGAA